MQRPPYVQNFTSGGYHSTRAYTCQFAVNPFR